MPLLEVAFEESNSRLYTCILPIGTFSDAFGIISIRAKHNEQHHNRLYARYASDRSLVDSLLLPNWMTSHFHENDHFVSVETFPIEKIVKLEKISLRYQNITPLACSLETCWNVVKEQLKGQLAYDKGTLPVVLFGNLAFFTAITNNDTVGIIEATTEILLEYVPQNDVSYCNLRHKDLERDLLLHLEMLEKSWNTDISAPNVILLTNIDQSCIQGIASCFQLPCVVPPLTLILSEGELEIPLDSKREAIELFENWMKDNLCGNTYKVLLISDTQTLTKDSLRIVGRTFDSLSNKRACLILRCSSPDSIDKIAEIFVNSIIIRNKTRNCAPRSFKQDYLVQAKSLGKDVASAQVCKEERLQDPNLNCSILQPSDTTWDTIFGYKQEKERLKSLLYGSTMHAEQYKKFGLTFAKKGILLHGPTGCGKSAMIKAVASDGHLPVIKLRPTDILSKYLGESEARLRRVFVKVRELRPCVLFIDNIEVLGTRRGMPSRVNCSYHYIFVGLNHSDTTGVNERLLSTLLNEIDGVEDLAGVIVVACTTAIDDLDDALVRPGRLGHHILIGLPSEADLVFILYGLFEKFSIRRDDRIIKDLSVQLSSRGISVAEVLTILNAFALDHLEDPLPLDPKDITSCVIK